MLTKKLCQTVLLATLMVSTQLAHAERDRYKKRVQVSVSYDYSMIRPDDVTSRDDAMRRAREMVYARVKLECDEMRRHIAATCELTQLNIDQSSKVSRREGRPGTISLRARAKYKIDLKEPQ